MSIRLWPRSIRMQMLAGLLLLETLSITLFSLILIREQTQRVYKHVRERLAYESTALAMQAGEAYLENRPAGMSIAVTSAGGAPSVAMAKVTDPAGKILYISRGDPNQARLQPIELAQIPLLKHDQVKVFPVGRYRWESASPIFIGNDLRGFAWIEFREGWAADQLDAIRSDTLIFGAIWIVASAILVLLMSNTISRPLAVLHQGTRALMESPETSSSFPLPVTVHNELGDLIVAFNRMVASIEEKRAGLNETLSLLNSMLAHAPIGLVFLDPSGRIVRVNSVFAAMTGLALGDPVGHTLSELLPKTVASELEQTVGRVMATEAPVHDVELTGPAGEGLWPRTWLVSAYPVRTTPSEVRWVGVIMLDASERKRSEEALRRTEKLAATGRLAASIAHEINNPLEAITNVLYLLRNFCNLDAPAMKYVHMADLEVRRMAEITQQTLRFYRQSTLPARANMAELIDSVVALHSVRLSALGIQVERKYDPKMNLFCFSGEVRQVIANLVGNAIDATAEKGGRLIVRARRSRDWKNPGQEGVRFTVADTGTGMNGEVRARLFEPFFTTKGATGTGLGLWVSHEIIRKHHGKVQIRSRIASSGQPSGTVFAMFFPDNEELVAPSLTEETAKA